MKRHQLQRCKAVPSQPTTKYCVICDLSVPSTAFVGHQRSTNHRSKCEQVKLKDGVVMLTSAFKCRIASYRVTSAGYYTDVSNFMDSVKSKISPLLENQIAQYKSLKVNFELFGYFIKEQKEVSDIKSFVSKNEVVNVGSDLHQMYHHQTGYFDERLDEFQEKDSGWILVRLLWIDVNVNRFNPMRAGSFIELPKEIKSKASIVNVENQDQCCFGWAIVSAIITPNGDPTQTTSYPNFEQVLEFGDIEFPVKLSDVSKFEALNPQISVNVYTLERNFSLTKQRYQYQTVGPVYYSSGKRPIHVNLLLVADDKGNQHYSWIKDLSRLVSAQLNSQDHKKYFCDGCLNFFSKEMQLLQHLRHDCNHTWTRLPSKDLRKDKFGRNVPQNILRFENYSKMIKVDFVIYADFETLLKPVQTCHPDTSNPFTVVTSEHQPHSFAYFIKCSFDDSYSKFELYRGDDVVKVFLERLEQDVQNIYDKHLKNIVPMKPLTPAEIQEFNSALVCYICEKPFSADDIKVRDHSHVSGFYRGAAHSNCNLNLKVPNFIPVFFHNLNYDSHLFVKQLTMNQEQIDVIPQTKEKYISFSKHILVDKYKDKKNMSKNRYIHIRFLDSYRFLGFSLAKLASTLHSSKCIEIKRAFGADYELMRQKGVFPYSYVDSFTKLDETSLPPIGSFYDTLREEGISQEEYTRATLIWQKFKCTTLGDYSDIYLKSDIFILTDIFENFREICLLQYKLDPAQYYTVPGLSWDAMLLSTSVELELLTDLDMLHFFKSSIRGGVSTCVGRKAVANNRFVSSYDPRKPSNFIVYLDATNLYGCAMRQSLPERDFSWMTPQDIVNFEVVQISDDSDIGYVLEVDLEYPKHLHSLHNDLPFCPELIVPPNSKFQDAKLIPNLCDKTKYVIHYRNLKQCLSAGLRLKKIHRILRFKQSPWLRPYVDMNTDLRNNANNAFEKDTFKLVVNSVFGKTMENVDKRINLNLVSHWETIGHKVGAEALVSKVNFKNVLVFSETLVAVQMERTSVVYDKPLYLGFSILDLSKTIIYEFYYDFLKRKYGDKVCLLYTDTDSLVLNVFTDNFYSDMKDNIEWFDTSNYPDDIHNMPKTPSVVGKMKDEFKGLPIYSFYGTAAKSYCVNLESDEILKAKGVCKSAGKKYLTSTTFQEVVEGKRSSVLVQMYTFRSQLHTMYTELRNKVALSSRDDKRYIITDTTKTLAWGHVDISSYEALDQLLSIASNYL